MSHQQHLHSARKKLGDIVRGLSHTAAHVHHLTISPAVTEEEIRKAISAADGITQDLIAAHDAHDAPDTRCDFTVEGSGAFPLDMLRYDECWPVDGEAVETMGGRHRRQVRLRSCKPRPTDGRWSSFTWEVVEVKS